MFDPKIPVFLKEMEDFIGKVKKLSDRSIRIYLKRLLRFPEGTYTL